MSAPTGLSAKIIARTALTLAMVAVSAPAYLPQAADARFSKSKSAPVVGRWSLVEEKVGGRPTCLLLGRASASTWLTLKVDGGDQAKGVISFQFVDMNWSITPNTELGEFRLLNASGGPSGVPVSVRHGLFFYLDADLTTEWLKYSDGRGIWLEMDGDVKAQFQLGNLQQQIARLRSCGSGLLRKDPFGTE